MLLNGRLVKGKKGKNIPQYRRDQRAKEQGFLWIMLVDETVLFDKHDYGMVSELTWRRMAMA